LDAPGVEKGVGGDEESIDPLAREVCIGCKDQQIAITSAAMHHIFQLTAPGVMRFLHPHAIKSPNKKGGGHAGRWDRRLLALWIGVHRMR
jgi:hypothetical protein